MKKGRHRRFEEARALKRNQDLDIESIFDSLSTDNDAEVPEEGYSPAYEAWAEDVDDDSEVAEDSAAVEEFEPVEESDPSA